MVLIYCASLESTPLLLIVESIIKLAKNVMHKHSRRGCVCGGCVKKQTNKQKKKKWMLRFLSLCVGQISYIFHHLQQAIIKTLKQKNGAKHRLYFLFFVMLDLGKRGFPPLLHKRHYIPYRSLQALWQMWWILCSSFVLIREWKINWRRCC